MKDETRDGSNGTLLTAAEVATWLRVHPRTVKRMAERGELPGLRIGPRLWRFWASEIEALLESARVQEGRHE